MFRSFNTRALGLTGDRDQGRFLDMTLRLAVASGFEGVDLLVRDLVDAAVDPVAVRARMDDLGLRGGAWPLPVQWRGDAAGFQRDLRRLPQLAEAAAVLGLFRTGTWVLPETPEAPASEADRQRHRDATRDEHVRRLGAIARVLNDFGVRLGLEALGVASCRSGRGLPFIHRMADLDTVLEPLQHVAPNVGVLVDGFHLYAAGEPIDVAWQWGIDRVVWVHVADLPAGALPDPSAIQDTDRGLPGENGAIDTAALLAELHRRGYDGPVTVEPMAGCRSLRGLAAETVAHRAAEALARAWPEPRPNHPGTDPVDRSAFSAP